MTSEGGLADNTHECVLDKEYLKRRNHITELSASYDLVKDQSLPFVMYSEAEKKIWKSLYSDLVMAQEMYGPEEIAQHFMMLIKEADIKESDIP